jgi:carbamate kinase
MARTAVIALGGNAITRQDQLGTYDEQLANARVMARAIASLLRSGWRVVVVHGNGPQVGNLAIQNAETSATVPPQPIFALGAMTQGQLGSLLALALGEQLTDEVAGVVSVVTHVVTHPDDPAFTVPTKPIGPFLPASRTAALASEHGWTIADDAGRGTRRLVPSPEPLAVLEADAIRCLIDAGYLVIACGGGGVPVAMTGAGYAGIEAVIDKDYAAQRLASTIAAEALVLVTGIPAVQLDFGKPTQRSQHLLTVDEAEGHLAAGHFPPGSMGPKVDAAIRFLRDGGSVAVITTAELAAATLHGPALPLEGWAGTLIVRSTEAVEAGEPGES